MLNFILFGPPGSGKGTQSERLIQHYGLVHISTGDIFRNEIRNATPLGVEAKSYMDQGNLVPDELTIRILQHHMSQHPQAKGFIFDGFPRTVAQAEALDAHMAKNGTAIHAVVMLEVPEEELIERLVARGAGSGRSDDSREVIENRLKVYNAQTLPVAGHYEAHGKLHRINGKGEIGAIFEQICSVLDALV